MPEILEQRLKELEEAEIELDALHNAGVDNWEGYKDAIKSVLRRMVL